MTIQWLGKSSFKIQTKSAGEEINIITDPYDDNIGLKMPRIGADIVTISNENNGAINIEAIRGETFPIVSPGEYERKGVFIYGILGPRIEKQADNNIIYKISSEDINILHLGSISKELSDEQLEKIGDVDVLLVPVGGSDSIDYKKAIEIIAQIEPKIAIPMNYKIAGIKDAKISGVDDFIKHCGTPTEKTDRLKISKKDLVNENTRIIILEA